MPVRLAEQPAYLPASWTQDAVELAKPELAPGFYGFACTVFPKSVAWADVVGEASHVAEMKVMLEEIARAGHAIQLPEQSLSRFPGSLDLSKALAAKK
ncbi:MAG: hypothetical protein QM765_39575 [Myxococcales bacterium]